MAHRRKPLASALALNTIVLGAEVAAGIATNSISVVVDCVHNLSDEIALALLLFAYTLSRGLSGRLLRSANFFNSVGLIVISAVLVWESLARLAVPVPVVGIGPIVAGLVAAVGNWGVTHALREAKEEDPAIRLAYVHNLGDILLSLAPAVAGALILVTGRSVADSIAALAIAAVIIVTTIRELVRSGEELFWPADVVCGHRGYDEG
jgi:cobalt-zinc-cadmium efflux system protein